MELQSTSISPDVQDVGNSNNTRLPQATAVKCLSSAADIGAPCTKDRHILCSLKLQPAVNLPCFPPHSPGAEKSTKGQDEVDSHNSRLAMEQPVCATVLSQALDS